MDEAFFFGAGDTVFGIYHPPTQGMGTVASVICPPLLNDYARSYAALRSVAVSLAASGHHVLRFDYRGTGESEGELVDVDVLDWIQDVQDALDEVVEVSGARVVRVLSARGGALVVSRALSSADAVDRIVFWDPLISGDAYVEELKQAQRKMVDWNIDLRGPDREEALSDLGTFRTSDRFVADLRALNDPLGALNEASCRIVSTDVGMSFGSTDVQVTYVDASCSWANLSEDLINPRPVLSELVRAMAE